jgi:hypothetical protein
MVIDVVVIGAVYISINNIEKLKKEVTDVSSIKSQ